LSKLFCENKDLFREGPTNEILLDCPHLNACSRKQSCALKGQYFSAQKL